MKKRYDCIIAGFGTAGAVAAIAAGRSGASVLVLERNTCPGGTHTAGGVCWYYMQKPVGIMAELDRICRERSPESAPAASFAELKKHVIEEEAAKAGVIVRYEAAVSHCEMENGIIRGISWTDPEGDHSATAPCFIDATGDALLCELAGARLSHGRASDGQFQPFTNSMLVGSGSKLGVRNFDAGRIDQYREPECSQTLLETATVHLCDDFSTHRDMLAPADLPGIREGKRLLADRPYTLEAFFADNAPCEEPVFYAYTNIDTHANDMPLESDLFGEWMIGCSLWGCNLGFPVPRRAISAAGAGVKNLLAAGRHLAVDHDTGHALRMNSLMGGLGEAAGIIAALAAKKGVLPDEVAYAEFAARLPLTPEVTEGNAIIRMTDENAIRAELASDHPGFAQWSARTGVSAATLVKWMNEAAPGSELRRHAAMVLAMKRNPAGVGELCAMVRERDAYRPTHSRKYNHARGYAALFCLGLLAEKETLLVLREALVSEGEECAYEYQTHAIAALVKLGNRHPERRGEIAELLRSRAGDPAWRVAARLKGTQSEMKRMDPIFRAFIAAALRRWGMPAPKIAATVTNPDAYERYLLEKWC